MKTFNLIVMLFLFNFTFAQEVDSPKEIARETTVQEIGGHGQFVPAAASLVAIWAHKDKKGFWQFSKSFGTNLAFTYPLKHGINKTWKCYIRLDSELRYSC